MDTFDTSMAAQFEALLTEREARLRNTLDTAGGGANGAFEGDTHEVTDFKDVAAEQTLDVVEDIQRDLAAHELEQVLAALRRLRDQSYGECLACGKPIDLRRLLALPSAPFCTACQSSREQNDQPQVRR